MKKNRADLIREFKRDTGHGVGPSVLEGYEGFEFDGTGLTLDEDFETTFAHEFKADEKGDNFLESPLGLRIANKWDNRAEELKEAIQDIEEAYFDLKNVTEELPNLLAYIEWLENQLY